MNAGILEEKLQTQLNQVQKLDQTSSNIIPINAGDLKDISEVPNLLISIDEAKERILMLQSFVREILIPGQDYGYIPNTKKPTLFKSGAEKLTDIFGFSRQLVVTNRVEDWNEGVFSYEVKAILISKRTGALEAEGIGSCNSKESKYVNQNPFNINNTLIKMAKKRAFIDAVLSATRASGLFTQDFGDSAQEHSGGCASLPKSSAGKATKPQLNTIQKLVTKNNISVQAAKHLIESRYSVNHSKQLSKQQASDFIQYLNSIDDF